MNRIIALCALLGLSGNLFGANPQKWIPVDKNKFGHVYDKKTGQWISVDKDKVEYVYDKKTDRWITCLKK